MNRNTESHFAELPSVDVSRSIFDRSSGHTTSFNCGELIPIYWDEILPGDTVQMTTSAVLRLQTLLTPIFSNMYIDTYFFFVPNRLVWNHWREFMGENSTSAWIPQVEYAIPRIASPENGWNVGTIADYMGVPTGVNFYTQASTVEGEEHDDLSPIALPFRAAALCAQEWFRDQNLTDPLNIPVGDSNQTGSNGDSYVNDVANGGKPFKVAKFHDYFSSCTPAPQKGPAVGFNFDGSAELDYPKLLSPSDGQITGIRVKSFKEPFQPYRDGQSGPWIDQFNTYPIIYRAATASNGETYKWWHEKKNGSNATVAVVDDGSATPTSGSPLGEYALVSNTQDFTPQNLYIDPSGIKGTLTTDISFTINELRLAFQLQKFYEKWSLAGSRYRETLKIMFGVTSPDARMMIPEYLGGHRFPISIHQIENTAATSGEFLGDLGAMSNTSDIHEDFVKSFTEHGYIIGFAVARYDHTYSQGLSKEWTRDSIFSYYWPVFQNLGNTPVYKYELDASEYETGAERKSVFGYQECYAEYRYKPSRVSGELRPGITNSLASWHLGDYYTERPSLSDSWIREDKTNVDRVLAVTSETSNQIFGDFWFNAIYTRPMPMYGLPGLIDHH